VSPIDPAHARAVFGVMNDNPERRGAWVQTFTGRKFWPLDPRAEDVRIEDLAHQLSQVCRYGGATRRFYSVAQHCVLVSKCVPRQHARLALLHDAAEAWIGDMVRPLKYQPEMTNFRIAEQRIEAVVLEAFGVYASPEARRAVKEIDDRIIVDEIGALMADPPAYWDRLGDIEALGINVRAQSPRAAEAAFLRRFLELFPEFDPLPGWLARLGYTLGRLVGVR